MEGTGKTWRDPCSLELAEELLWTVGGEQHGGLALGHSNLCLLGLRPNLSMWVGVQAWVSTSVCGGTGMGEHPGVPRNQRWFGTHKSSGNKGSSTAFCLWSHVTLPMAATSRCPLWMVEVIHRALPCLVLSMSPPATLH